MGRNTQSACMHVLRSEYALVAVIFLISSVLALSNLGNQYLWGDEAATALVSKTILSHGIPKGTDGLNLFSQVLGAECNKDMVWIWHPWFPFYLLAGLYALLGVSTFTSRLPFALMGIGTVVLAYYYARNLWKSRQAGFLAALLLATSVPLLILVRQCRYYSPEVFFSLLGLYGYQMMVERRRMAWLVVAGAAFLLFHTHYVQCAALLASVLLHSLIFHRDRIKPLALISVGLVVINIPWIRLFFSMNQVVAEYGNIFQRSALVGSVFLADIFRHIVHPGIVVVLVLLAALYRRRHARLPVYNPETGRKVWLLMLFTAITVMVSSATGQNSHFRYIAPVIPALCAIMGLVLTWVSKQVHVSVALLLVLGTALWLRMPDYLYEITHDYDGPTEGTAIYLNENARPTDVVATNHEDLPLKFYTGMRVISGVTGEDWAPAREADWIVYHSFGTPEEAKFTEFLVDIIESGMYEQIEIPYPDIPYENREEPDEHNFRTVEDAPFVQIFRRIED